MKITVWVVSTCIPELGAEPCQPSAFGTEAEAETYAEEMLREEWAVNGPIDPNDDTEPTLPYPGDWRTANDKLKVHVGPEWGEWQITSHEIETAGITAGPEAIALRERALPDEQIRIWINACNHEPARDALRELLAYRVRGYARPISEQSGSAEAEIGIPLGGTVTPPTGDLYLDRFPPEVRPHAERAYQDGYEDGRAAVEPWERRGAAIYTEGDTSVPGSAKLVADLFLGATSEAIDALVSAHNSGGVPA